MEGGVGRWALAVVVEWALATDVAAGRGAPGVASPILTGAERLTN
jgi:hypothetical protein